MDIMEYSHGTVRGKEHLKNNRNNQDALALQILDDVTIAVVCDGCGSGNKSEVGAAIGAQLMAQSIREEYTSLRIDSLLRRPRIETNWWWDMVEKRFLARLMPLIYSMGPDMNAVINEYFLFTTVVSVIDKNYAVFASIGDGVIYVNGENYPIGPFPGNRPPYILYQASPRKEMTEESLKFQFHKIIPTAELESFLIGCDGVEEIVTAQDKPVPGSEELVGDISDCWTNNRYFKNPALLTGRLLKLNGGLFRVENENLMVRSGLLHDDTTLIVGRKKVTE